MKKSLQIAYPVCFSLILFFLITSSTAVDLQKSFVPFTGERILRFSASTIQYDPELFGKVTPTEEEPPPGICIGSGGHPCICTNCKCCTSDCPPCKSSPVLSGGVYQRIDTDFSLPGRGFSYDFNRHHYSSGKNIASLGIAWSSPLDTALIIVGETRAYFQFEQTTVEFDGNRSANCADIYHALNYSRRMLSRVLSWLMAVIICSSMMTMKENIISIRINCWKIAPILLKYCLRRYAMIMAIAGCINTGTGAIQERLRQ